MWSLERLRARDVVRVGRDRIERWVQRPQGLVMISHRDLAHSSERGTDALAEAMAALFQEDQPSIASSRPIDLVLESAWLPAFLLDVGSTLWSRRQVEALLRHRLTQLYDERDEPVSAWSVQLDHRPGDLQGLGYALAPSVKDALANAAATSGRRWASLQPAFAWGWQRLKAHRRWRRAAAGWWVWIEQDRALVAHIQRGRVGAMNAGAMLPRDEAQLQRLIEIEASRFGVDPAEPSIVVAGWQVAPSDGHPGTAGRSASWVSVSAGAAAAESCGLLPLNAGTTA